MGFSQCVCHTGLCVCHRFPNSLPQLYAQDIGANVPGVDERHMCMDSPRRLCLCLRCEGHHLAVRKKTGDKGSVIWGLAYGHFMRAKNCRALRPTKPHFFLSQLQQTFSGSHSLSEAAGFPEQHCEHVIIVPYRCSREGDSAERNEFILVYSQD